MSLSAFVSLVPSTVVGLVLAQWGSAVAATSYKQNNHNHTYKQHNTIENLAEPEISRAAMSLPAALQTDGPGWLMLPAKSAR